MANKPTASPQWASQDQNDGVTGSPNKIEPTDSYKLSGMTRSEPLFRQYLNFILNNLSQWVNYFEESTLAGKSTTTSNTVSVTIPDQGSTDYQVILTPKANLGNFWTVNDSPTQFTINVSSGDGDVDWVVVNK